MRNLKTPQGTVKKGIAHFSIGSNQSPVGSFSGIDCFNTVLFNNSKNIIKQSATQVLLKAGCTYKLYANILFNNFSDSTTGYISFRWTDYTNSKAIGTLGFSFSSMVTGQNWSTKSTCETILTCTTDMLVGVATDGVAGTAVPQTNSTIIIEELEAYLIQVDPTKYVETINFTNASGTGSAGVVIPSGLPIGTKKLIRKINSTQGTVEISCSGETFTPSEKSSITLNSNGDFWLLEKVKKPDGTTRWDLLDGNETGSNANGLYIRYANLKQKCILEYLAFPGSGAGQRTATWTFPANFSGPVKVITASAYDYASVQYFNGVAARTNTYAILVCTSINASAGAITSNCIAEGEW